MTEFGLLHTTRIAGATKAEEHRVIREAVDAAQRAESLGFDRFYVQESELPGSWHTRAPEVLLGAVAVITSRIRLAYGAACVPFAFNHPVRVAQRAATLDVLSDGRLDVAFGLTSSPAERALSGVSEEDARAEFPEGVSAIVQLWTESETEYHSDRLDICRGSHTPSLVQQPHPNLIMACTDPDSIALAGRYGLGVLCDGSGGPDEARSRRRSYDDAIADRRPGEMLGNFAYEHFTVACHARVLDDPSSSREPGVRPIASRRRARNGFSADRTYAAHGSVQETVDLVESMVQAGVDEILFVCDRAEISREDAAETIANIGEGVIPHFRRAPAIVSASQAPAG
jgi:alkanesulfonate monooxygenase SsuD/methylene tetrahydromethanopterin reductase-like flavin-dependent oxidoreductase (luciferase family)